ncbi:MAG: hypothetical protein AB8G96_02390 [Phycisphaerales bacterium]
MSKSAPTVVARSAIRTTFAGTAAACALAVVPAAHADIIVDDFSSGDFTETISAGLTSAEYTGTMIGGVRFAGQFVNANPFDNVLTTSVSGGLYEFAAGDGVVAGGLLGYGAGSSAGALNLDVSGETAFEIQFGDALATSFTSIVSFGSSAGSAGVEATFEAGSTSYVLDLSELDGLDLTDIDLISVGPNPGFGEPGLNFSIDRIAFVPAPGAIALFGLAGLAGARRRRG